MKLWVGHNFAARSCCIDPNVERDMSPQYGDHFCEIVLQSDFNNLSSIKNFMGYSNFSWAKENSIRIAQMAIVENN